MSILFALFVFSHWTQYLNSTLFRLNNRLKIILDFVTYPIEQINPDQSSCSLNGY